MILEAVDNLKPLWKV